MKTTSSLYDGLGVSAGKEQVHAAVDATLDAGAAPGAFCRVVRDPTDPDWLAILHSDGAGSKALVAYLAFHSGADASVFRGLAQDAAVMNLDDMACVGATDGFVLSNTIGRNPRLVGEKPLRELLSGYADFAADMGRQGIRVLPCGGETADLADQVRTLVVDCSAFARLPAEQLIDFSQVQPGDLILGLASDGQLAGERRPNSGIGSNGLTLARHALLSPDAWRDCPEAAPDHPEPSPGRFGLDDELPGTGGLSLTEALLSPTRSHLPLLHRLKQKEVPLHGLVHCTGGGQTKCLHFGSGLHYIKNTPFEPPSLFRLIAEQAQVPGREMYQVFNMGHRMELYCPPDALSAIREEAGKLGMDARQIGEIAAATGPDNQLTIHTDEGELRYGH